MCRCRAKRDSVLATVIRKQRLSGDEKCLTGGGVAPAERETLITRESQRSYHHTVCGEEEGGGRPCQSPHVALQRDSHFHTVTSQESEYLHGNNRADRTPAAELEQ